MGVPQLRATPDTGGTDQPGGCSPSDRRGTGCNDVAGWIRQWWARSPTGDSCATVRYARDRTRAGFRRRCSRRSSTWHRFTTLSSTRSNACGSRPGRHHDSSAATTKTSSGCTCRVDLSARQANSSPKPAAHLDIADARPVPAPVDLRFEGELTAVQCAAVDALAATRSWRARRATGCRQDRDGVRAHRSACDTHTRHR